MKFNADVVFIDTSGQVRAADGDLTLRADDSGQHDIIVGSGNALRPEQDRVTDLGLDYLRWHKLYVDGGDFASRPEVNGSGVLVQGDTFSGVFASAFVKQDATQSTTSQTFVQALRLTTPSLEAGTYRMAWSARISSTDAKEPMQYRVQLDDTVNLILFGTIFNKTRSNGHTLPMCGFDYHFLAAGVHTIDIDFLTTKAGSTAYIEDARLEIWKML